MTGGDRSYGQLILDHRHGLGLQRVGSKRHVLCEQVKSMWIMLTAAVRDALFGGEATSSGDGIC